MQQLELANPIAAVTEPNPYSYYAELVAYQPMYYDETLKCWVASSAEAVQAVLISDLCRVRPIAEPVPNALLGTPGGDIFKYLIRMNDGEKHDPMKRAVSSTFAAMDVEQAAEHGRRYAPLLIDELGVEADIAGLSAFIFQLPAYVVASLLGIPEPTLPDAARWTSEFVSGLAPAGRQERIEEGAAAASHLLDLFQLLTTTEQSRLSGGLLHGLTREANAIGCGGSEVIIANAIGFLSQTFDATAGLIGNAIVTLSAFPDVREALIVHPALLYNFVREVLRFDSPIQNTRRFVVQDGMIAGHSVSAGEIVLVVLAAANRDPAANPHPDRFELFRENRQLFTFGVGAHACPGEALAAVIAVAALEALLASDFDFDQVSAHITYRPSVNARIPLFGKRPAYPQVSGA